VVFAAWEPPCIMRYVWKAVKREGMWPPLDRQSAGVVCVCVCEGVLQMPCQVRM
jgi:hypothetical protein